MPQDISNSNPEELVDAQSLKQENFIRVYDDVLSKDLIIDLIKCSNEDSVLLSIPSKGTNRELRHLSKTLDGGSYQFEEGKLGRHDHQKFLKYEDTTLLEDVHESIYPKIGMYMEEFDSLHSIGVMGSFEVKLQKTPPHGGYSVWHCEQGSTQTASRVLAWIVYLNDLPEGEGETEFLYQGLKVPPKEGTLVIFPAYYTHTHRGNPPYSANKYIVTGWIEFAPTY